MRGYIYRTAVRSFFSARFTPQRAVRVPKSKRNIFSDRSRPAFFFFRKQLVQYHWQPSRGLEKTSAEKKRWHPVCDNPHLITVTHLVGGGVYRYGPATHRGERVELLDEKPPGPFHVPAVGHEAALRPVKNYVVSVAKTGARKKKTRDRKYRSRKLR